LEANGNIKGICKEIGYEEDVGWIYLVQDMVQWWDIVNTG
jgi:hypothetical protein